LLKALVIMPNEKISDVGALLAVAREGSQTNPPIRALQFIAELGVYVAIYEAHEKTRACQKSKVG
jgi:hypothetical protein